MPSRAKVILPTSKLEGMSGLRFRSDAPKRRIDYMMLRSCAYGQAGDRPATEFRATPTKGQLVTTAG